ncbi:TPA: Lar family restriction alleviation protein [Morganella morganii subsp. morganii]|nr:Lar family restriction alleviation protein [Morganella morganii subsp. morganii]
MKPCPFCGGDASYLYKQSSTTWYVFCGECESSGAESYSENDAIAAWNRRAPQCEKE